MTAEKMKAACVAALEKWRDGFALCCSRCESMTDVANTAIRIISALPVAEEGRERSAAASQGPMISVEDVLDALEAEHIATWENGGENERVRLDIISDCMETVRSLAPATPAKEKEYPTAEAEEWMNAPMGNYPDPRQPHKIAEDLRRSEIWQAAVALAAARIPPNTNRTFVGEAIELHAEFERQLTEKCNEGK